MTFGLATASRFLLSLLMVLVISLLSPEPVAVFFAVVSLVAILAILWTPSELPILLIAPLFQWSQVALVPLSTVWLSTSMADTSIYGGQTLSAALFGLAGVTMLALGMRIGLTFSRRDQDFAGRVREETVRWSQRDILLVAATAILAGYALEAGQNLGGSLREAFNQASSIKYLGLFILVYWCLTTARSLKLMMAVILVDLFLGMTGFFAEFQGSALVICAAALSARPRFRPRDMVIVCLFGGLILLTAIFWSAVKPGYRDFVNLGTGQQIVSVPLGQRADYMIDRLIELDGQDIALGFTALVARHGYIEFLGLTLQHVPAYIPHERGELSLATLRHISMPRLLFPSKPPLPWDTEVMARYTGLPLLWDTRTSISIGYLGELYVDFGVVGSLLAMATWGFVIARAYSLLRNYAGAPCLMRAAVSTMIVLPVAFFGMALAKVVGGFVFAMIISTATQRILLPLLFPRIIAKVVCRSKPPMILSRVN